MKYLGPAPLLHENVEYNNCSFAEYTEVGPGNYLENVVMERFAYTSQNCILQNVRVGSFANIAAHVRIGPTRHPMERPAQHHFTYRRAQYGFAPEDDTPFFELRCQQGTVLEPDIWIGHAAIVMPGLRIGTGAVIGAGSVVTRDVPDYAIVVGNPARLLRLRFTPQQIAALLAIRWWEWPYDQLRDSLEDFSLPIDLFISRHLLKHNS